MKSATLVFVALAATAFVVPSWADVEAFAEVCPERTTENHPEIEDADAGCSCLIDAADEDMISNLQNAQSLDDLTAETTAMMQECGYNVP
ncbi:MAG: hypothetical protein AAGL49_08555 [Pseudomonadota bacterium]